MTTSGHSILPAIQKNLPFDVIKDFTPVMMVCAGPLILVTHPQYPAKNLKELIAMAKEKPGSINFASAGTGSAPHMALELLKFKTGTDIVHVPYRGGPPAMADVIAGVVQAYFAASATAMTQLQGGTVRALAQTTGKRSETFKDIPTVTEQGVPEFDLAQWYGLVAPAKMPAEIVEKIRKEVTDSMGKDEIRKRMLALGCEPQPSTREAFGKYISDEVKLWADVAKEAKLGN
jgi:tripartite-type tricarboxylate transporter receptor subunit TctC